MSNVPTSGKKRLGKLSEVIAKGVPSHMQAEWEAHFRMELKSPDLSSVRVVSLEDQFARLANEQTVFWDIATAGGVTRVRDLQHKFRERRIGSDTAAVFNPNGDFAAETESNRPTRDNTVGFVGSKQNIRYLAQELGEQSPVQSIDLMAEEVEDALLRIKRKMNAMALANTEVKAETVQAGSPQPGGFITRSSLYNLATSGDLTNALIQGRVNAIANAGSAEGLGFGVQLMALCHAGQLAKVQDLMIARYPGESSDASERLKASLLSGLPFQNLNPYAVEVYKPRPGRPILFVHEPQLPTGNCLFFTPQGKSKPRVGKFQMFGSMGPWALERPEANLLHVVYVWDNFTIIDELVETRALLTGLND